MNASFRDSYIQVSTNASAWTGLSGSATVEIPAGSDRRPTATLHPYHVDTPAIVPGRRDPLTLIVTYNYAGARHPQYRQRDPHHRRDHGVPDHRLDHRRPDQHERRHRPGRRPRRAPLDRLPDHPRHRPRVGARSDADPMCRLSLAAMCRLSLADLCRMLPAARQGDDPPPTHPRASEADRRECDLPLVLGHNRQAAPEAIVDADVNQAQAGAAPSREFCADYVDPALLVDDRTVDG